MLIVVAIIAILIAISIPTVKTALEKSRHAVDDANKRAAIGLGNIYYLTEYPSTGTIPNQVVAWYEVDTNKQGKLGFNTTDEDVATSDAVASKCTNAGLTGTGDENCSATRKTQHLKVTITKNGVVSAAWASDS